MRGIGQKRFSWRLASDSDPALTFAAGDRPATGESRAGNSTLMNEHRWCTASADAGQMRSSQPAGSRFTSRVTPFARSVYGASASVLVPTLTVAETSFLGQPPLPHPASRCRNGVACTLLPEAGPGMWSRGPKSGNCRRRGSGGWKF